MPLKLQNSSMMTHDNDNVPRQQQQHTTTTTYHVVDDTRQRHTTTTHNDNDVPRRRRHMTTMYHVVDDTRQWRTTSSSRRRRHTTTTCHIVDDTRQRRATSSTHDDDDVLRQQGTTMAGHGNDDGDGAQRRIGRDNKRPQHRNELESLVCFSFSLLFFYFNVYSRSPQHVKMSMAATAATAAAATAARDTTYLEPLVFFIYL